MTTLAELLVKIKTDKDQATADIKQIKKDVNNADKDIKKTSSNIASSIKKIGASFIALGIAGLAKDFVAFAGEIDSVGNSFKNLAKNADGGSKGLLRALQVATKGTVDNLELMRSSNLALQLMGEDVAKHLPRMAEIAAAAARTQGASVQQMMNDIVVATGRQSVMILDNLGISSATASKEMEKYAASLGKTREQLTEAEKKAAFFNAVMVAGGEIVQKAGGENITLGESLQRLKTTFTNIAVTIGEKLAPYIRNFAENVNYIVKTIQTLRERYLEFSLTVNKINTTLALTDIQRVNLLKQRIEILKDLKKIRDDELKFDGNTQSLEFTKDLELKKTEVVRQQAEKRKEIEQLTVQESAMLILGTMQSMFSSLGGLLSQYVTNRTISLDNEQYKEQQSIDARYEARKEELENTITDEEELAAALQALDEKKARETELLEEKMEKKRRKLARDAAKKQKQLAIAETLIAIPQAAFQAFKALAGIPYVGPALGIVAAAAATALGLAKLSMIRQQPLPEAATGGVFDSPYIGGEAGREMAVPLESDNGRNAIRSLASGMLDVMSQQIDTRASVSNGSQSGGGSGGDVYLDGEKVGRWLTKGSNNGLFTLNSKVVIA